MKNKEVKKYTLEDLLPKGKRIDVEHPVHGDVGAWFICMPPQSVEYLDAYAKRIELDLTGKTLKEKLEVAASLPASVITDWNTDLFGPFSKEAVLELLSKAEFSWLMFGLSNELEDGAQFYQ